MIPDKDQRIERLINTPAGKHPITVEQGQDAIVAPKSLVTDATLRVNAKAENDPALAERMRQDRLDTAGKPGGIIGDRFTMPDGSDHEGEVAIGPITFRPSSLVGFEKAFTRNASDFELVREDGSVATSPHECLRLLYDAVVAAAKAARRSK